MATIEQMAALHRLYRRRAHLPFRTRLAVTFGAVAALHAAAVVLLLVGAAGGGQPLGNGLVLTAYLAGVKHSYDWDHLAAIDNSTRKFTAEHRDPVSVGFAFSLGHSSVVVLAGVLVVTGASLVGSFMTEGSPGNVLLGLIGSGVSGLFLLAMGAFNGTAFLRTLTAYRKARKGAAISSEDLAARGFVARLLTRPLARVRHPRNIYVIGFLFGLGFDTATTIGLLVMATAASLAGVSPLALLALPLAFAAAMTLCDTTNGVAMMRMYRSALADPRRKLGFNAVITGISAVSALVIAVITLGGTFHWALGLRDPLTVWLASVELGDAGLLLIAVLLTIWAAASLRWRLGISTRNGDHKRPLRAERGRDRLTNPH
ncbi:HoxN/HupN/NixA family nickel/cobalt transporter [Arthrobacter sp. ov118]|uniref:HoxN/HupN/NixA family nickel/cobalt transporter n=1 Tax=Arthrobacter sp. ov118 TaxID=1761747 RepID=UPI0008E56839|nr:nickel transporter [Arthrobacter sp. ov118]SFT85740.1 high-affinity nickel-transport protein [Arthrobacter sp. ov118]